MADTDIALRAPSTTFDIILSEAATAMYVNVGDVWKAVTQVQINVGDAWKIVTALDVNVSDSWKGVI
jgi:hypothetical protein